MEGNMNSGYEGSLPEALGEGITIIGFFITIIGSYIIIFCYVIGVKAILAR